MTAISTDTDALSRCRDHTCSSGQSKCPLQRGISTRRFSGHHHASTAEMPTLVNGGVVHGDRRLIVRQDAHRLIGCVADREIVTRFEMDARVQWPYACAGGAVGGSSTSRYRS